MQNEHWLDWPAPSLTPHDVDNSLPLRWNGKRNNTLKRGMPRTILHNVPLSRKVLSHASSLQHDPRRGVEAIVVSGPHGLACNGMPAGVRRKFGLLDRTCGQNSETAASGVRELVAGIISETTS